MTEGPLFAFEAVGLVTDGRSRLVEVDLAIPDRAVTVVVGASGSGKSTLLRMLNRLEVPTTGVVRFRGQDLTTVDVRAHRRRVGMLFQRPTPFAGTVRQNLLVAREDLPTPTPAALLERVGLDDGFLDRPADRLSGGEAQRMCLARTLATRPEVLLADEATSSLDPEATRRLEQPGAGPPRRRHPRGLGDPGARTDRPHRRPRRPGDRRTGRGPVVNGDVNGFGLLASLILIAVAVGISRWQRLGLEGSILVAVARATGQLLLVGLGLGLVLSDDAPLIWSWLWVAGIIVFAAVTVQRRAPAIPGLFRVAVAAQVLTAVISLGVIFGLSIFPLEARTLVPVSGMILGNALSSAVLAARRLVEEFTDKRDELEARLALGCASHDAARPYLRVVLRTAMTPQIESTKAVGLVFLPGAMTGLVLAGVDPLDAVLVQLALMLLILGGVAIVSTVITLGAGRRLFTPDERLVPLLREAEGG